MDKNVLLVGRKAIVLDDVREGLAVPDVTLFSATTLNEVRKVFGEHPIDTVIMGASTSIPASGSLGTSSRRATLRPCT
jgi:hypothetical protein